MLILFYMFALTSDSPNVSAKQSRIGQKKYKDVVLECEVSANPTATVTWYKEATAIVPTWKYRPEVRHSEK